MRAKTQNQRPFGSREFAAERSHQDAHISNENARAAAQAAVLINGGAATAVIAFLSKEKISDYLLSYVPFTLLGYALGVFFGASMVFCAAHALKYWGLAWRTYMANPTDVKSSDGYNNLANKWNARTQASFIAAMVCFLISSAGLAFVLFNTPLPK